LVVEGEVDALAKAIAQLLTSPNLRHQLGMNGQCLASRRYSWSAIASNLTSVYTSIIQRQPLPDDLIGN
jgi:glycosyltransferase involved in cell wall biosynthesis